MRITTRWAVIDKETGQGWTGFSWSSDMSQWFLPLYKSLAQTTADGLAEEEDWKGVSFAVVAVKETVQWDLASIEEVEHLCKTSS